MKPITRHERYLAAISNDPDANGIDSPETRIEQYLAKIAGETTPIPDKPITRIEQYLAKIAGEDVAIPEKPLSRVEMYLAAIAKEDIEVPEPITRGEWYLAQWAENGSGVLKTVNGALVHIADALAKPLKKCEVTLEPIQSGSGDPSPDNVRPITGHTGVSVVRTGANIWDEEFKRGYWAFADGNFVVNDYWLTTNKIACKPSTYYEASASARMTRYQGFVWYDASGNYISSDADNSNKNIGFIAESPSNAAFMIFDIAGYPGTTSPILPTDVSNFEIREVTTIPITFPDAAGTVYGGTMDLVSGKLSVEWYSETITDVTDFPYDNSSGSSSNRYWRVIRKVVNKDTDFYAVTPNGGDSNGLFSWGKWDPSSSAGIRAFAYNSSNVRTISAVFVTTEADIRTSSGLQDWIDSKAENNSYPQITYRLKTPIEYDLTPQEITALLGENNIWSSGSGVEVTYRASAP